MTSARKSEYEFIAEQALEIERLKAALRQVAEYTTQENVRSMAMAAIGNQVADAIEGEK